jgi:GAF domain-containing protein
MSTIFAIPAAQEAQRLQAFKPYKALENAKNEIFEEIAKLTAKLFVAPIAQVSLVGADEVTYPGNVGYPPLPARLPRQDSICAVAVYQPGTTTVFPDLRAQPCQWVSEQAQKDFAFYASHPLQTHEGAAIGTLCVLDKKPREFSATEQLVLQRLAGIAMRLLDLQLVAAPEQAPALWTAINARVRLSLQRIETLTALARWEVATTTAAAQAYQASLHEEQMLIVQDIEYEISMAFARIG